MEPIPVEEMRQKNPTFDLKYDEHENYVYDSKIESDMPCVESSVYSPQDSITFPTLLSGDALNQPLENALPTYGDMKQETPVVSVSREATKTSFPVYSNDFAPSAEPKGIMDEFDLYGEFPDRFCAPISSMKTVSGDQSFPMNDVILIDGNKSSEIPQKNIVNNSFPMVTNITSNSLSILDAYHPVDVQSDMTLTKRRASCSSAARKQKGIPSTVELHSCGKCGKKYRHATSLKSHVRKHDNGMLTPKRYQCSICPYSSQYNRNVQKHMHNSHSVTASIHSRDWPDIKLIVSHGRKTVPDKSSSNVYPEARVGDVSSFEQSFVSTCADVQTNVHSQCLGKCVSTMGLCSYDKSALIESQINIPQAAGNSLHELLTQQTKFSMETISDHTLCSSPLHSTPVFNRTTMESKHQRSLYFPSFVASSSDGCDVTYSTPNVAVMTSSADIYSFPGSKPTYMDTSSFDGDGSGDFSRSPIGFDSGASLLSTNFTGHRSNTSISHPDPPKSLRQSGHLEMRADVDPTSLSSIDPINVSFVANDTEPQHSLSQQSELVMHVSENKMYNSNSDSYESIPLAFNYSKVEGPFCTSDSQNSHRTTNVQSSTTSENAVGGTHSQRHLTPETDAFLDDLQDVLTRNMVPPKGSTPKELFDSDVEYPQGSDNQSSKYTSGSVTSFQGFDSGLESWSSGSSGGAASVSGSQETPRLRALSPFSNTPKQAPLSASSAAESFTLNVNDGTNIGPPTDLSVQDVNAVLDFNVVTDIEQSLSNNSSSCTLCPQTPISFQMVRSNTAQSYNSNERALKHDFDQASEYFVYQKELANSAIPSQPPHGMNDSMQHCCTVLEPQQLSTQIPVSELPEPIQMQTNSSIQQFSYQPTPKFEPVIDSGIPSNYSHSYPFAEQCDIRMKQHGFSGPSFNQANQLSNIPYQHSGGFQGCAIEQVSPSYQPAYLYGPQSVRLPQYRNPTNCFYQQSGYSDSSWIRSVPNAAYSGTVASSNNMGNTLSYVYPQHDPLLPSDSCVRRNVIRRNWTSSPPEQLHDEYPQNVYLNPVPSDLNHAQHMATHVSDHSMYNQRRIMYGSSVPLPYQNQLNESYPSQPIHHQPTLHTNYGAERCVPPSRFPTARSSTTIQHKFPRDGGSVEHYQGHGQIPYVGSSQELSNVHDPGRFVKFDPPPILRDEVQESNRSMECSKSMKNLMAIRGMDNNSVIFPPYSFGNQNEPIASSGQTDGFFHHHEQKSDVINLAYQLR